MKRLAPLEKLYHLLSGAKNWLYDEQLIKTAEINVPVVSVGNISFGGVGKTPCIILLAEEFSKTLKVAVICKSYKALAKYPVKVDLKLKNAATLFGDEACLLQKSLPGCSVWAGPVKSETALASLADEPQIILLDDGFSHRKLKRNFDLVLLDASTGFNSYLREDFGNLKRANAVLLTKSNLISAAKLQNFQSRIVLKIPALAGNIFTSTARALLGEKPGCPLFIYCGIGNPESLLQDLELQGFKCVKSIIFKDHHAYTEADEVRILSEYQLMKQQFPETVMVSTAKDLVKIKSPELLKLTKALGHSMEIYKKEVLIAQIRNAL